MNEPIDVDAILDALGPDFDDPGVNPWGTANRMCEGPDLCDLCRELAAPDDTPALKAAFEQPRQFEPCSGGCCREDTGCLTDAASERVLEEFDRDFPESRP